MEPSLNRDSLEIDVNRKGYRSSIPAKAREIVHERYENGTRREAFFFVGRKKVGYRSWWDTGGVEIEYGIKNGKKHGVEFHFDDNGELTFMEPFRNGTANGIARQWSNDGRLLITYTLRNGNGLDLWCHDDGSLAEELYWPAENELGYRRWWNEDDKTIYEEYFWVSGRGSHGITRKWNTLGKLCRGFPQYHVNDQTITKRQYLVACESDPLLIRFRPEDNKPFRDLPPEYLAQQKKRDTHKRR